MRHRAITVVCLNLAGVLATIPPAVAAGRSLEVIHARQAELQRRYAEDLSPIAKDLRDSGATDAAATAWRLAVPPESTGSNVSLLPKKRLPEIPDNAPAQQRNALIRFRSARQEQAVALQVLARQALESGAVSYAYDLVREAARQDPDNRLARLILGFVRYRDRWVSPFAARMLRAGQVWHDRFGWLPEDHVARYEAGQRYYRRRWISAAQDAELHRNFTNPWLIRTEHYLVKTNHSIEKGVAIATKLERFHDYFVETFAGFFWDAQDLEALFRGNPSARRDRRPYQVHYYRTRKEYNRRLIRKIPQIAVTNGLYYTADRIAYFYHDEDATLEDTLYHEATHQLLYEALPYDRAVAEQANFWIIEGIACYMESFRFKDGVITIGDPEHPRMVAARYRYLVSDRYIPLARFAAMGVRQFQNMKKTDLQKNYSQAAGLAHFFMNYDDGRYRAALVEHLAQLYGTSSYPPRRVQHLAVLTGVPYRNLDQQYGQYMQSLGIPRTEKAEGVAETANGEG